MASPWAKMVFVLACLSGILGIAQSAARSAEMTVIGDSTALNPKIGIVGTLTGFLSSNPAAAGRNRFMLDETEFNFSSIVDPYSRADIVASFSGGAFSVEEGFLTLLALPGQWQARLGKLKARFGKLNAVHAHEYPFIGVPIALSSLFGADGWNSDGVEVSHQVPMGLADYSEVYVEMLHDNAVSFQAGAPSSILLTHWRNFWDVDGSAGIDTGLSWATGENALQGTTNVYGVNANYKNWVDVDKILTVHGEWFLSQRQTPAGTISAPGAFGFAAYRPDRQHEVGVLVDYGTSPTNNSITGRQEAAYISYLPSEFTRFRLQAAHVRPLGGGSEVQAAVQVTFIMGPHRAHSY